MKNIKYLLYFGILASLGLASCSTEDVDTEKPVIIINEPHNLERFAPGGKIHFDAGFSDNVGLKQFKTDIHYGGGHIHKSNAIGLQNTEWSYVYTGDLEGRNKHIHMDIAVPENVKHGEYHLIVYCTDQSGNESFVVVEILVGI